MGDPTAASLSCDFLRSSRREDLMKPFWQGKIWQLHVVLLTKTWYALWYCVEEG